MGETAGRLGREGLKGEERVKALESCVFCLDAQL